MIRGQNQKARGFLQLRLNNCQSADQFSAKLQKS